MSANAVPRQRRKGFAALGISVLNSDVSQDQKDIKFRSHGRGRDSEHDMDLQAEILKGKSRDQDRLLAIVAGLQEGIEDLLAGRVFHPKQEEEEECPRTASSGSSSDGQNEKVPSPTEEAKQEASAQSGQEAATRENKEAVPVSLKKSLAGMPIWIEHEVHSDDEDSNAGSAEQGASDDESVGSFLHIAQHDIDDLVQETDEKKLEQQVGWGRAATNRIMYEWKEYARVKIMEEVNQWFQHRSWAAREEAEMLDEAEATSREILASEHESIRALKTAIERKEIALVSSVSSFRQNMDRRVEQHWAAKRRARDQAIAQVQREEEQRRQERLRRQQERAAKKFSDIDDQIADIKDSIEQVKGEIHKKELMKHTYPSGKRRASAAGGAKAGDVLAIIASQQEEAQVLSGKLVVSSDHDATLSPAELVYAFLEASANSRGFARKESSSSMTRSPQGDLRNHSHSPPRQDTDVSNTIQAGQYLNNLPRQDSNASSIQSGMSFLNRRTGFGRSQSDFSSSSFADFNRKYAQPPPEAPEAGGKAAPTGTEISMPDVAPAFVEFLIITLKGQELTNQGPLLPPISKGGGGTDFVLDLKLNNDFMRSAEHPDDDAASAITYHSYCDALFGSNGEEKEAISAEIAKVDGQEGKQTIRVVFNSKCLRTHNKWQAHLLAQQRALLDVVTGKLKAAEQSLKAEDEVKEEERELLRGFRKIVRREQGADEVQAPVEIFVVEQKPRLRAEAKQLCQILSILVPSQRQRKRLRRPRREPYNALSQ